jgi:hypothetical protein
MGIFLDALIGNYFIFLCIFLIYTYLIVLLRTFLACTWAMKGGGMLYSKCLT